MIQKNMEIVQICCSPVALLVSSRIWCFVVELVLNFNAQNKKAAKGEMLWKFLLICITDALEILMMNSPPVECPFNTLYEVSSFIPTCCCYSQIFHLHFISSLNHHSFSTFTCCFEIALCLCTLYLPYLKLYLFAWKMENPGNLKEKSFQQVEMFAP